MTSATFVGLVHSYISHIYEYSAAVDGNTGWDTVEHDIFSAS